jgi:hypothetical protein
MIRPRAIQTAWLGASLPRARALRHALRDPERAQRLVLTRYLRDNADTAFGRRYGFASIRSAAAYQESIPLAGFDEYVPWIDRIRAGESRVLTSAPRPQQSSSPTHRRCGRSLHAVWALGLLISIETDLLC